MNVLCTLGWPYTEGIGYIVTISFGYILHCVCFNLYCGCFILFCNATHLHAFSSVCLALLDTGYLSQYSDKATGWTIWGSCPGRGKELISPPKRPDRFWGRPSRCTWGSFPLELKREEHEFGHSLHLAVILRIGGDILLFPTYLSGLDGTFPLLFGHL